MGGLWNRQNGAGVIDVAKKQTGWRDKRMTRTLWAGRRATRRLAYGGFTFLEIIVVVAILGILAAIVIPNMFSSVDDAKRTQTITNIGQLKQGLEMYRLDNSRYPTTEQGLKALVEKPTTDPTPSRWKQYLPEIPKDGWGNDFAYICPATKAPYEIRSAGQDGKLDTDDDIRSTDPVSGTTSTTPR